jgi:hypothetical protein
MRELPGIAPAVVAMPFADTANAGTGVVVIVSGDRLTGEPKSLERGKLRFKAAATDTVSIEWDDIASLTSDQNIQVATEAGKPNLGVYDMAEVDLSSSLRTFPNPSQAGRVGGVRHPVAPGDDRGPVLGGQLSG